MLSPVACGSVSLAIAVAGAATADVTPSFVQVNATAAELVAAGIDRSNNGLVSLSVQTASGSESAFALVGSTQSSLPNQGYFDSQFVEFQYGPYSGLASVLVDNVGAEGWDPAALIKLISGQPVDSAMAGLPGEATGEYSRFDLWRPGSGDADGGVVWLPNVGDFDVSDRLSASLGLGNGSGGSDAAVSGATAVPAPGVFALLGLAGLAGGFRRRR